MDRQREFVLRTLEERDIRFVRLWFTDVLGFLKSVAIAPRRARRGPSTRGIGFDGSSIEGFSRVSEADTVAKPDPSTFQVLPFLDADGQPHSARMFCDVMMPKRIALVGRPAPRPATTAQPRGGAGFQLLRPPGDRVLPAQQPAHRRAACPSRPTPAGTSTSPSPRPPRTSAARPIDALESVGISVEFSHHEAAPGQQEIDLRYADALSMADNVMTFRYLVKEVAIDEGVRASFMPKPFTDQAGSAMHTHMSLFEGDVNAFHDPANEHLLSATGRGVHRGHPHPRPRDQRGHQPVGQLLQAPDHRGARHRRPCAGAWPTAPR